MAKQNTNLDLLDGFALMGGLAILLEVAGFVGDLLDTMSESARHELVDAFAATRPGQAFNRALDELNEHSDKLPLRAEGSNDNG